MRNFQLWLAYKFLVTKHQYGFTRFISYAAIIGLAIGIMALITTLAVMNGFQTAAYDKLYDIVPHVMLRTANYPDPNTKYPPIITNMLPALRAIPAITAITPVAEISALLLNNNKFYPVVLQSLPEDMLRAKLAAENRAAPQQPLNGIIINTALLRQLDNYDPQHITLLLPSANHSDDLQLNFINLPISTDYTSFVPLSKNLIFITDAVRNQYFPHSAINTLLLKISNPLAADQVAKTIMQQLPYAPTLQIMTATTMLNNYLRGLIITKKIMFILLTIVIIVASFNNFATLSMIIHEKTATLALLRSIGCNKYTIQKILLLQGLFITTLGIILGNIGGYLLSKYISDISSMLGRLFQIQFVDPNIYLLNTLPSQYSITDAISVSLIAILFMFIATVLPARKAMRLAPAVILRYE